MQVVFTSHSLLTPTITGQPCEVANAEQFSFLSNPAQLIRSYLSNEESLCALMVSSN